MAAIFPIAAREVVQSIEIKVTGLGVMRVRWAIAAVIFRLAAWVAGCSVLIETGSPSADAR